MISAGGTHSLICNTKGQVFSFGNNQNGQLGLDDRRNRSSPTLIEYPKFGKIVAVSAGGGHSLILNVRGQVYSFGYNEYGQLGLVEKFQFEMIPLLIDTSKIGPIVAISAGGYHSLILNDQGQVYAFGQGICGQLGLDDDEDRTLPTLIECPEMGKIIAISAGQGHSLILNDQGQVYSFGENEFGQLGHVDNDEVGPSLISITENKLATVAISAGADHSLVISLEDDHPQVFGFGDNEASQLGLSDTDNIYLFPTLLEDFKMIKIAMISSGYDSSLVLTSQGQVYRLGQDGDCYELFEEVRDIIAISNLLTHQLFLDAWGQVYSFGLNKCGQLGLGDDSSRDAPTLIEGFRI
jgi:alpha-tubulin suppressor-like RCC1 family protein